MASEIGGDTPEVSQVAMEPISAVADGACVYCGQEADTRDHVVCEPWSGQAARKVVKVVPACRDCNSRLGDFGSDHIPSRSAYLAERLRIKHADGLLRIPDWSEAELGELEYGLRRHVASNLAKRRVIRSRLWFLDRGGYQTWLAHGSPVDVDTSSVALLDAVVSLGKGPLAVWVCFQRSTNGAGNGLYQGEIERRTGLCETSTRKYLRILREAGFVDRGDPGTPWRIVGTGVDSAEAES